jgi:two-component system chemotaxis response regulator CheY
MPGCGFVDDASAIERRKLMSVRALIVDDSPVVRRVIRYHVAIYGVRGIDEAENAFQALSLFRENKPNLTTLDLMMPESKGVGSRELFDAIKKEAPDTAILIVSAIPYEKVRENLCQRRGPGLYRQTLQSDFLRSRAPQAGQDFPGVFGCTESLNV